MDRPVEFAAFFLRGFLPKVGLLNPLPVTLRPSVFPPPLPEALPTVREGVINRSEDPHRGHLVRSAENACRVPVLALQTAFVHRFILSAIECLSGEVYSRDVEEHPPVVIQE